MAPRARPQPEAGVVPPGPTGPPARTGGVVGAGRRADSADFVPRVLTLSPYMVTGASPHANAQGDGGGEW